VENLILSSDMLRFKLSRAEGSVGSREIVSFEIDDCFLQKTQELIQTIQIVDGLW
jgi:hypothetical protein